MKKIASLATVVGCVAIPAAVAAALYNASEKREAEDRLIREVIRKEHRGLKAVLGFIFSALFAIALLIVLYFAFIYLLGAYRA